MHLTFHRTWLRSATKDPTPHPPTPPCRVACGQDDVSGLLGFSSPASSCRGFPRRPGASQGSGCCGYRARSHVVWVWVQVCVLYPPPPALRPIQVSKSMCLSFTGLHQRTSSLSISDAGSHLRSPGTLPCALWCSCECQLQSQATACLPLGSTGFSS